jgi:hypothetical protein
MGEEVFTTPFPFILKEMWHVNSIL